MIYALFDIFIDVVAAAIMLYIATVICHMTSLRAILMRHVRAALMPI